jgi:GDP-L-fucose synthase
MVKKDYKAVVVTGGTGFLGSRLKIIKPDWIYLSSKDIDLTKTKKFTEFLLDNKTEAVIHLAAKTGGILKSIKNQSDFHYYNSLISMNVLKQSYEAGVSRILSCLSTCCYPNIAQSYPMKESFFLSGVPTESNYGYALAKRELYIQTNFYRKFYNLNYSTFTPCNLYGPGSNFDDEDSHFIASLIKKLVNSMDIDKIKLLGTGSPLRQHLYIDDLAKLIPVLLVHHNTDVPVNIAPIENYSIKELSELAVRLVGKKITVEFTNSTDGQIRKDVDNNYLMLLLDCINFTSIEEGLIKTIEWYKLYSKNYT